MASALSRMVALFIKMTRSGNWKTADAVRASIAQPESHTPPLSLRQSSRLSKHTLRSIPYYIIEGANTSHAIFYFHGGGYIHEIDPRHWGFCFKLSTETGARVIVPIYPLAPETNYLGILKWCDDVVSAVLTGVQRFSFTGDSAGGGLSLALAMMRRDAGTRVPDHLGLISPALDCALENPDALKVDDPWLSVEGVREAGRLYAGPDVLEPYASPIRGTLEGLRNLCTMIGTRDVLYPDAKLLALRAAAETSGAQLHEVEDMIHVWPLLPIPEAKVARTWLVRTILKAFN